jgi:hypothetical protein
VFRLSLSALASRCEYIGELSCHVSRSEIAETKNFACSFVFIEHSFDMLEHVTRDALQQFCIPVLNDGLRHCNRHAKSWIRRHDVSRVTRTDASGGRVLV